MTTFYKLTNADDQTYGDCQWGEGVTHTASGNGELCTRAWIHVTTHPLLAVLLNPVQGNYDLETAHLWEGEATIGVEDSGLKVGCTAFTSRKRVEMPQISLLQCVAFGILCALEAYHDPSWVAWANGWLSGKDRSAQAAWAAAWAAQAARAAEEATEEATEEAAARAAAWAAEEAAVQAAAQAAQAARAAGETAARHLPLVELAQKAMGIK